MSISSGFNVMTVEKSSLQPQWRIAIVNDKPVFIKAKGIRIGQKFYWEDDTCTKVSFRERGIVIQDEDTYTFVPWNQVVYVETYDDPSDHFEMVAE